MAKTEEKLNVLSGIVNRDEKTYSFQKTINFNGEPRTGSFVAKYMGIGARLRLGSLRAKLLDGAPNDSVDPITDDIAYMVAYLSVTLIKRPSWFNFDDIDEYADLRALYQEVYDFTQRFREKNDQGTDATDSKATNGEKVVEDMQRTAITAE